MTKKTYPRHRRTYKRYEHMPEKARDAELGKEGA